MRKNKTYNRKPTKYQHRKQQRLEITLILAIVVAASIIGHVSTLPAYSMPITPSKPVLTHRLPINQNKPIATLSIPEQIQIIAYNRHFAYTDYLLRLMNCESRGEQYAINTNKNGSKDLGLFQINDIHGLSAAFRFDINKSANWTMDKIENGHQSIWVCDHIVKKEKEAKFNIAIIK